MPNPRCKVAFGSASFKPIEADPLFMLSLLGALWTNVRMLKNCGTVLLGQSRFIASYSLIPLPRSYTVLILSREESSSQLALLPMRLKVIFMG